MCVPKMTPQHGIYQYTYGTSYADEFLAASMTNGTLLYLPFSLYFPPSVKVLNDIFLTYVMFSNFLCVK